MATIGTYDIAIGRGDSYSQKFTFSISLAGATVYFTVREKEDDNSTILHGSSYNTFGDGDTSVTIEVPESDNAELEGTYYYAIQVKDSAGTERTYVKGKYKVLEHAGKSTLS